MRRFYIPILAHVFTGNDTAATAVCTNGSLKPQSSGRPKRRQISSPGYASSLPADGNEELPVRQRHKSKRLRKAVERDKPAVDATPLPSKGMFAILLGRL